MTEEHKAVVHMSDMGLLHIQCELQFVFKELSACLTYCFRVLSCSFDNDHKIIRVSAVGDCRFPLPLLSHSNRTLFENREVPRPPILPHLLVQEVLLHPSIEFMQHDVG